jgi:hypothetical protein
MVEGGNRYSVGCPCPEFCDCRIRHVHAIGKFQVRFRTDPEKDYRVRLSLLEDDDNEIDSNSKVLKQRKGRCQT